MTVECLEAENRSGQTKMDIFSSQNFELTPQIPTCGDQYSLDLFDTSIYASSPNSLYMYDQEKLDMQSSLGVTTTASSTNGLVMAEEFDLKAQYEASRDIPVSVTSSANSSVTATVLTEGGVGATWGDNSKDATQSVLLKPDKSDPTCGPTLAELNFSLLDDIENYINVDMSQARSLQETPFLLKGDKSETPEVKYTEMTPVTGNQTLASVVNTQNTVPAMSFNPAFTVKTEPVDLDMGGSYKTVMSPSLAQRLGMTAQRLGMTRPSSNTAHASRASQQIDSKSALQKLLQASGSFPSVLPTSPVQKKQTEQSPSPSRKRSQSLAGLETVEEKWEEIKQFIHNKPRSESTSNYQPIVKRERQRVDSTSSVMTLTSNEDEDSDSDHNDFDESQSDSDFEGGHDIGLLDPAESLVGQSKEKQYFWQYNVQSKGPKGTRVHFDLEENPHVVHDFEDPVFDPNTSNVAGVGVSIKHGGKARKGDGNDIIPNPKKLCQIGLQLRKISRQINDFAPVSEMPSTIRSKKRKEKNKLASRACRLKKKAQHEAHKVKLHGIDMEHRQLLRVISLIQRKLLAHVRNRPSGDKGESMTDHLQALIQEHLSSMVAGHSADYVNSVVRKVEEGDPTGGLVIKATMPYPKELRN